MVSPLPCTLLGMNDQHTLLWPLTDGRTLAVEHFGSDSGTPVLFLPSAPGSRLFDPNPPVTAELGVRLLVVDRPGYGRSSSYADGVVPSWNAFADDLGVALEQASLGPLPIIGWSSGGVGALALASRRPDLVSAVGVVASPAPDDEVPWLTDHHRGLIRELRRRPSSAFHTLTSMLAELAAQPDEAVYSIAGGPGDQAVLDDLEAKSSVVDMLREAFRQGARGTAADIIATHVAPWRPDLAAIKVPVRLFYARGDTIVPPDHGAYYRDRLPQGDLCVFDGLGHLCLIPEWRKVLRAVLSGV